MAVTRLEVYPTCDIHLLLNGPGGFPTEYQLEVRDALATTTNLTSHFPKIAFSGFATNVAKVSLTGRVTPVGAGETFCRIRYTDPFPADDTSVTTEIIVRIRVHHNLSALWIGNNRATIAEGKDNYVLTVYAAFDDGTIGDISSHPYLSFSSTSPSKVEVNDTDDKGRLSGKQSTGNSPVMIRVAFGGQADEVGAFVVPAIPAVRPILKQIRGNDDISGRRNMLFVAEGFLASQERLFSQIVTLLTDEFFSSRLHSPFYLLKDSINVWTAFDPSPEEGVSSGEPIVKLGDGLLGAIGRPIGLIKPKLIDEENYTLAKLVLRVGLPDRYPPGLNNRMQAELNWAPITAMGEFDPAKVEDKVLEAWFKLRNYNLMQVKDSLFGMMNGYRCGDAESTRIPHPDAPPKPMMQWYVPDSGSQTLLIDRRRMSRSWTEPGMHDDYFRSLRKAGSSLEVGKVWTLVGADSDLFIFVVNSALRGGTNYFGVRVCVRQNREYSQLQISGRKVDHNVPEMEALPSLPAMAGAGLQTATGVLAHEFGHALGLGEEYEGGGYAGLHDVMEISSPARRIIRRYANLVDHYWVVGLLDTTHIDMDKVKWTGWHRIKQCSRLTKDAEMTGIDGELRLHVKPEEHGKWKIGDKVFVRVEDLNSDTYERRLFEGPLEIKLVSSSGAITLTSPPFAFPEKGLIYQPVIENGQPLAVFDPVIMQDLRQTGEAYARKGDPSKANDSAAYPSRLRFTNPDFKRHSEAFVVGLYEGGGGYNTRVYRPSGMCKMREEAAAAVWERPISVEGIAQQRSETRFVPFCYVCSYFIVNIFNPQVLVDLPYPD